MTEGVVGSRAKVGVWLVAEERDKAFVGSEDAANPLQERTSIRVPLVTLDIRLTERFGVQAAGTIPDVTRTAVVQQPTGTLNYKERFRGLGDTSVLGWYRMRPIAQWNILLNAGASIPTGKTEVPRFRPELQGGNLVPMSRLQRGSGTLDPLLGLTANRRFGKLTAFGNVAARTPVYANSDGLRTGSSWEISVGSARELGTHRVVGYGRLGWLHRQQDWFQGTPVLVGGGNWLYLTPGVALKVFKGVDIQTEVKLPVYRSLANHQLDSRAVFQFGVSRAF